MNFSELHELPYVSFIVQRRVLQDHWDLYEGTQYTWVGAKRNKL